MTVIFVWLFFIQWFKLLMFSERRWKQKHSSHRQGHSAAASKGWMYNWKTFRIAPLSVQPVDIASDCLPLDGMWTNTESLNSPNILPPSILHRTRTSWLTFVWSAYRERWVLFTRSTCGEENKIQIPGAVLQHHNLLLLETFNILFSLEKHTKTIQIHQGILDSQSVQYVLIWS